RREELLLAVEKERTADGLQQPFGDVGGVLAGARQWQVVAQHGELVAAEPGDGVTGSHHAAQSPSQRHEQLVASVVAEAVVDDLEPVEVEEQHRKRVVAATSPGQGELEELQEQRAVRE